MRISFPHFRWNLILYLLLLQTHYAQKSSSLQSKWMGESPTRRRTTSFKGDDGNWKAYPRNHTNGCWKLYYRHYERARIQNRTVNPIQNRRWSRPISKATKHNKLNSWSINSLSRPSCRYRCLKKGRPFLQLPQPRVPSSQLKHMIALYLRKSISYKDIKYKIYSDESSQIISSLQCVR